MPGSAGACGCPMMKPTSRQRCCGSPASYAGPAARGEDATPYIRRFSNRGGLRSTCRARSSAGRGRQLRATSGTVALVTLALAVIAATQARLARHQVRLAQLAQRQEQAALYDADLQLAANAWENERTPAQAVRELLDAHMPGPGEEDGRDF